MRWQVDGLEDNDRLRADLFGDDDDEDVATAKPLIEEDIEGVDDDDDISDYEQPSAAAAASERRSALQALAAKTKEQQVNGRDCDFPITQL